MVIHPRPRLFPRPQEGATRIAGAHGLERLHRPRAREAADHTSTPGMLGELATGRTRVRGGGAEWGVAGRGLAAKGMVLFREMEMSSIWVNLIQKVL